MCLHTVGHFIVEEVHVGLTQTSVRSQTSLAQLTLSDLQINATA